ncbi:hypothetical protein, partial [Campylobacter troglodytis]|uniref:hypothetical protein n=1 Tax=Campylobacter troglodytis TaxID=654363 RepID=UPI00115A7FF4
MKVLLLNKNPIISKLVRLSAEKLNYDFEEQEAYDKKMTGYYEFIIVDNEIKADLKNLENRCKKLICLSSKNSNIQDNIQILHKPFLPTDLISLIKVEEEPKEETPPETEPTKEVEKEAEDTTQEELADLDLDSLDLADEDTPKKHIEGAKEGFEEADIDNIFNNEDKLKIKPPNKEYVQDLVDDPLNLENETSNLSNTKNEADKTAKAQDSSPEKAQASKEDLNSAKSEEGLDLSELNLDELEKNLNEPLKEEAKNSASDLNLDKVSSEDLNLDLQEKASSEEGLKEGLNEDLNLDSVKEDVKASSEDLASLEKTVLKDEEVANVVEDLNEDLNLDLSEGDLNSKEGAKEGLNEDLNSGSSSKEGLNEDLNLDLNEESLKEG